MIDQTVYVDQSYCISGRSIKDSNLLGIHFGLSSLNQGKAFDQVEHHCLWTTVVFKFFQKKFRRTICLKIFKFLWQLSFAMCKHAAKPSAIYVTNNISNPYIALCNVQYCNAVLCSVVLTVKLNCSWNGLSVAGLKELLCTATCPPTAYHSLAALLCTLYKGWETFFSSGWTLNEFCCLFTFFHWKIHDPFCHW